jgi:hypothetical protein
MQPNNNPLATLPLYHPEKVWHIGSFNPAHKYKHGSSLEGTGLSVSECPEDWCYIARLGGHPTWELAREGAQFLDYHALSDAQRAALVAWGIEHGYAQMREMFTMTYFDSEHESHFYQLLHTRAQAEDEAGDYDDATIEAVTVPCPTDAMHARLKFLAEPLGVTDFLATFYVEDATALDGVWWHDTHEPEALSAPRGVIVVRQLPAWSRIQSS